MITIRDLEPHHCRFIVNDDTAHALYCGESKLEGSSYCAEHHRLCYTPAKQKTKEVA